MQYSYCALQPWEALLGVRRDQLREARAQAAELGDDSWPGPLEGAMTLQREGSSKQPVQESQGEGAS